MRIAVLIPSLAKTGPIIVVEQLVKQLSINHYVEVFYFDDIIEIKMPCKCTKISFYKGLDFSAFDLIHTHMLRCDIYYFVHQSRIKIPAVSTIHQYIEPTLLFSYNWIVAKVFARLWEFCLRKHKQLVCINRHMSELYLGKKINSNITFLYNGLQKVEYADISYEDKELFTMLRKKYKLMFSICRLNKSKGIQQVLPFLVNNINYLYVVIGDGPEFEALRKKAIDLGVQDRFLLLGFKYNATDYLKYADLFVLASYFEGFGLALAEAASASIPIVCSNIPTFKEMFSQDEVAFFDVDNLSSLTIAIRSIVMEGEKKANLALINYNKNYTPEVMSINYLNIYKQIIA